MLHASNFANPFEKKNTLSLGFEPQEAELLLGESWNCTPKNIPWTPNKVKMYKDPVTIS